MIEDDTPQDDKKFENPEPKPGESQKAFIERCIPYVKNEHPDWEQDQIVAVCYSIWRRKHEGKNFKEYMESMGYERFTESAQLEIVKDEGSIKPNDSELSKNSDNPKQDTYKLVAMVGDRFMNGGFFSMKLLKECYHMWERTFHDYNHEGTGSGIFGNRTDISKFVGYHKNVQLDENNKRVTMELVPVKETAGYNAWKGFVELAKQAGRTPNVSVTYWGKRQFVKTSDLPNEADWQREGFKESDMVPVLTTVLPECVSTVLEGKCNDKAGCGIQNTNTKCGSQSCEGDSCKIQDAKEHEEQVKRIKEKQRQLKMED